MANLFVHNERTVAVERQHSSKLSPTQFMHDYVAANRPVLIENAVDWPARPISRS